MGAKMASDSPRPAILRKIGQICRPLVGTIHRHTRLTRELGNQLSADSVILEDEEQWERCLEEVEGRAENRRALDTLIQLAALELFLARGHRHIV